MRVYVGDYVKYSIITLEGTHGVAGLEEVVHVDGTGVAGLLEAIQTAETRAGRVTVEAVSGGRGHADPGHPGLVALTRQSVLRRDRHIHVVVVPQLQVENKLRVK